MKIRAVRFIVAVTTLAVALSTLITPSVARAASSVTLRATSTLSSGGSTTSFNMNVPTGVVAGDVLVAALSLNGGGAVTAPAGWTLIGHTVSVSVVNLWTYYRVAGAAEPASYAWSSASTAAGVAGIAAYVGVDPTSPLIGFSSATDGGTGAALATAPGVTTTASSVALLVLTVDGAFGGTVSYPAGLTQRWALTNYEHGYLADNLTVKTGNLPAQTINLSSADFWSIQQIALRVSGSTPAPAPTVTGVLPNSGATGGGTAVTVNGSNFQSGATVSFGGAALSVSTVSATAITGSTSAHAAGAVNVVVTNPDAQSGTCTGCYAYGAALNAIQIENQYPGDPSWDDFASVQDYYAISGYGSQISVNRGNSIDFFVTTTAPTFTIDIYRTGWYGGVGARNMTSLGTFPGLHQAIPLPDPVTGIVVCKWVKSTTFVVPATWTTGVYLAKLNASSGNKSFIFFVVRNDSGHEDFAFQTSVTTYQAYNVYGGTSLYNNNTDKSVYKYDTATKVSFDRPFIPGDSNGAGHYLWWEYPFVRWAESQGFDMTYITDVDTHTNVNPLTNHKGFLSVGHDEYWSRGMRENVQNAINAGVNVAFFSANTSYWQIRFEPNDAGVPNRVEVGYKVWAIYNTPPGPDPMYGVNNAIVTTNWREDPVNQPENGLIGVMYEDQVKRNAAYVVQNASHWVYAGTGFVNGSSVPGIVGYEYDKVFNNGFTPSGITILSSSPVRGGSVGASHSNSTIYTAPSGARVFAAGTIQWSQALDNYGGTTFVNAGIRRTTANILNNFRGGQ